MRPVAWVCLVAAGMFLALRIWSIWYGAPYKLVWILCVLSIGLFLGSRIALQATLLFCRGYLLLFLPVQLWPWIQLQVWKYPGPVFFDFLRLEVLPAVLLLAVLVSAEITRSRLREPLRSAWHCAALLLVLVGLLWRAVPAIQGRRHIDPAAEAEARRIVTSVIDDPLQFYREAWWEEPPWNVFDAKPAWRRPVMKCSFRTATDMGASIGERGIGSWIHHPKTGNPKGIIDYQFRDGSCWKGVEVTRYGTNQQGLRVEITMELRISNSAPTHSRAPGDESMPALFPEL